MHNVKNKITQKLPKLQLLEKPRHVTLINFLRYNSFQLCLIPMSTSKCEKNHSILKSWWCNNNFFYWKVRLFRGREEIIFSNVPSMDTEIAQPPKQTHRSPRWHMKDKLHTYVFKKKILFDVKYCSSTGKGKSRLFDWLKKLFWGKHIIFLFQIILIPHLTCWICF